MTIDDDDLAKVLVDAHASMRRRAWVIYYIAVVTFVACVIASCILALAIPVLVIFGSLGMAGLAAGLIAPMLPIMIGLTIVVEKTRQKWAALEEW